MKCDCQAAGKAIQYICRCEDCECETIIEFDEEPNQTPYCCGKKMIRK